MRIERREGRPLVIGHRGAAAVAPANTRASLEAAIDAGADLVEFDIGLDLTIAHSRDEVPEDALSLDDALELVRAHEIGAHLDVKEIGPEEAVVAAIRRHELGDRVLVSTAFARTARRVRALAPELPIAIGYPRDRLGVSRLRWPAALTTVGATALRSAMPARVPVLLGAARANVLALHHTLVSRQVVAVSRARGAAVVAWVVNDADGALRLERLGVDAVVTDDPALVLRAFGR